MPPRCALPTIRFDGGTDGNSRNGREPTIPSNPGPPPVMTRRTFLATQAAYLQARERVTREVFLRSPAKGTAVMADAYYTESTGGAMVSIEHRFSRSDTVDAAYYRYSKDYGRTWGPPIERNK